MWERERSGRPARGLRGWEGERLFKRTDPQAEGIGFKGTAGPPTPGWSPTSPELGSLSQVPGACGQGEEAAWWGPEGLGVEPLWGADPWAERAERGSSCPSQRSSCNPGLPPSWNRESLACSGPAAWNQSPLAGPPLCPCQGRDGRPTQMAEMAAAACVGRKGPLLGGSAKQGTGAAPPESALSLRIPSAEVGLTYPHTPLRSPAPPSPCTAALLVMLILSKWLMFIQSVPGPRSGTECFI